jgi:hypothetical protein
LERDFEADFTDPEPDLLELALLEPDLPEPELDLLELELLEADLPEPDFCASDCPELHLAEPDLS